MRQDAVELDRFYATKRGQAAERLMLGRIVALWPSFTGLDVLGLGFATPLLDGLPRGARRMVAAMPASQGAVIWPASGNCSFRMVGGVTVKLFHAFGSTTS